MSVQATCRLLRFSIAWAALGVGFNVSQRVLDLGLDWLFSHVKWLQWLVS
jgi:hypothetical protein